MMDSQQDNRAKVNELLLNSLMLRLGFHWVEPNLWVMDGDTTQLDAIEVLRQYDADRSQLEMQK